MTLALPVNVTKGTRATAAEYNLAIGWIGAPRAVLYNGGATVVSGTPLVIPFNAGAVISDSDTLHDPTTNNTRITLSTLGWWEFEAWADFSTTTGGTYRALELLGNGVVFNGGSFSISAGNSSIPIDDYRIPGTAAVPTKCRIRGTIRNATITDYLEVRVSHDKGSNMTVPVSFSARWVTGL